jgi:Kef-type K+ transport system membrane component KefB
MHHLLNDIGIAVLTATVLGLLAHYLRQPIILGYLIAGALIGPQMGLGLIHDAESIEIISEIGLILLLFIIGLELDVKSLFASGKQLLVAGFGQFVLCVAMGVGLFAAMGYGLKGTSSDGLYLALMCGLSSTAVVVKLLYDKGELDTLPGRMTLGVLVIQDIYAIFVLAFQPNFANPSIAPVAKALAGTVLLLVAGFLFSKIVMRRVFSSIAKAPEMVVAVSIGWCAAVAGAAAAMGLSKEMGALVAGLCIGAFPYSMHVTAKTLPLRDFFLTLFFMSLGLKITVPRWDMVGIIALLVAFTVVSRFLSVYPLLALTGAGRRTAFVTSLNLSQISEFSLVIAMLGVQYGHIGQGTVAVVIYAMAITAVLSSYSIRFSHPLYVAWDKLLTKWRPVSHAAQAGAEPAAGATGEAAADAGHDGGETRCPVVLLGVHRSARSLVALLEGRDRELLRKLRAIDFNPETLRELGSKGVFGTFGDIGSLDTLAHSHLDHAKLILCTIPDMLLKGTSNETLVRSCRSVAPAALIVAVADDAAHEQRLRAAGADFVIAPHTLVAEELALVAGAVLAGGAGAGALTLPAARRGTAFQVAGEAPLKNVA